VPGNGKRDPIDIAARALRTRDRSRRDLDARLERAGVEGEARAQALETLERVGYLDEERFAVTRAATLAARGHGDASIRHELEEEGIPPEVVEVALDQLEPERDRALRLAASVSEMPAEVRRLAGRLRRLGFSEDALEAAVGTFAEDECGA
jgi:regulatory protein